LLNTKKDVTNVTDMTIFLTQISHRKTE